jgi:putative ABC transport system permease protein
VRAREVAGEVTRMLVARPIQTALVAGLAGAMVVVVLATVGRTVALEQTLQERTETPEGRTIVVTDTSDQGHIVPLVVRAVAQLEPVETVMAFTSPVDATNSYLSTRSTPIPLWGVTGDLHDITTLRSGRLPEPGEGIVAAQALSAVSIGDSFGALTLQSGEEVAIVGTFEPLAPFGELAAGAVWRLPESADRLRRLDIVVARVADIDSVVVAVVGLFDPSASRDLRVERVAAIAELQQVLAGDVDRFSNALVTLVLLTVMLLSALAVFVEVLTRRRDLGRQRALGARRSTVTVLLVARTAAAACCGTAAGMTAGLINLHANTDQLPPVAFSAGLAALSILAPSCASALPAWWAARRDPVLELRTP